MLLRCKGDSAVVQRLYDRTCGVGAQSRKVESVLVKHVVTFGCGAQRWNTRLGHQVVCCTSFWQGLAGSAKFDFEKLRHAIFRFNKRVKIGLFVNYAFEICRGVIGIGKKLGCIGFWHGLARSAKFDFEKLRRAIFRFDKRDKIGLFVDFAFEFC